MVVQTALSQNACTNVESGLLEDRLDPRLEIMLLPVRVASEILLHG
jgi:hypothetical protein